VSWLVELRALDRRVWALAAARLVVTAGFSMVMPFLAIHLTMDRNVSAVIVGAIWTAAGALGAVAQWAAGELADRIGRRNLMLAAMLIRALNLAAMGLAIAAQAHVLVIAGLVVLNAVLRAFFDPIAAALVADLVAPEGRVSAYSLQRVGINIGWATGPAVAALAGSTPYPVLFFASAPLTLLAALGIWNIREPTGTTSARSLSLNEFFAFRTDKRLLRFLAATLAFYILQVQLYQTMSIYAARVLQLTRTEVGTLYTLNGILVVLLQLPAVRFIRRLGTRGALVVGCLGYAASYTAVGLAGGYLTLLACIAAVTLSEIVTSPAQQTTVTGLAPAGRVGAYTGLFGFCQVVGQSTGPLIGTALLDGLPPRAAWLALALFGVGAAIGYRLVAPAGGAAHAAPHKALARQGRA
jgi:MFS family permease